MRLVLASSSPRRAELLERLGLDFDIEPAGIDESRRPDEGPGALVERLAREKAAVAARAGVLALAADTAVVHEGRILGKPSHPEEARGMLRRLQDDRHDVFTGVAVAFWEDGVELRSAVDVTEVAMMPMTVDEIADYVATGEPMDKAGAYALQGLGGRFVGSVSGSPFTVIGLPLHLLPRLISQAGVDIGEFSPASGSG